MVESKTRLLISASEVVHGLETVFDSAVNKGTEAEGIKGWRQRLPLSLRGVAASGTLPQFSPGACIEGGYYWDGLYSQNPPVREFLSGVPKEETPDELWIVRINPQQWPEYPDTRADIIDRENELVGNLSLNKELDFIGTRQRHDFTVRRKGSRRVQARNRAHHQDGGGDCKQPSIFVEV